MSSSTRFARLLPLVVVGASLLAVSGCTAVGPEAGASSSAAAPATAAAPAAPAASGTASSQTKATACTILGSSLQDLSNSLQSAYSKYATDPKAAVTALQKVSATFQSSVAKVTEPGATALATKAEGDLQTLISDVQNAVNHPITGAAAVQKLLPTLESDFTKIGSYCK
ncbi:hypothetical protein AX769_11570 [Frondihabitans sp. PAMC 28766]|uniref:hypothetical protein n=1 Tax=Frondihabitans sp. PAMC 28766 TaxID=1795630 RepID=UPI00078C5096|nr:hypothetical protein [Frondihabitans sp. PAMC 28766]AMM20663.1 hypothetical protein AX769_11570 [Frondihabitans sp. PAMC 28766]